MNAPVRTDARRAAVGMAALCAAALALRAANLTRFSFWADECLTVFIGGLDARRIVRLIVFTDVHPPLYYLLLHLWRHLGGSEAFLRAFSLIPGVLSVPVFFLLARRVVSPRAAWIAAALLAVNPLHVVQSQQIRYPAFLLLMTLLAVLFFHRTLAGGSRKDAAGFVAASFLMLYTNYLSLGVVAFAAAWLAITWREALPGRRLAIQALAAVAVLFLPGAALLLLQSGRIPHGPIYSPLRIVGYTLLDFGYGIGFWGMPRAGSADAELAVLRLAGRPILLALTLLPFAALLAAGLVGREGGRRWSFPRLYLAVVLPFAWAVCARADLFQAKYVLPALPPFLLVVASGIDRLARLWKPALVAVACILLPLTAYGLGTFYARPMPYQEYYRELARFLVREKQPGDAVFVYHAIARECTGFYARRDLGDLFVAPRHDSDEQLDPYKFLAQMKEIERGYKRLWVVYYYEGNRDPRGFARAWFPVQFRRAEIDPPRTLRGLVELYTIPALPPG